MPIALAFHVLAVVVWVGGMFFAYQILRPAAQPLEPSVRLPLWSRTFTRFFPWVWAAILVLLATGYDMAAHQFGGLAHLPPFVNAMQGLGWLMILIYLHLFFAPYRRLRRAAGAGDFVSAAKALAQIRVLVGVNTLLGLLTIVIAVAGAG
ncbi:MAG: CopD family protein [Acidiferrobacter sp.]